MQDVLHDDWSETLQEAAARLGLELAEGSAAHSIVIEAIPLDEQQAAHAPWSPSPPSTEVDLDDLFDCEPATANGKGLTAALSCAGLGELLQLLGANRCTGQVVIEATEGTGFVLLEGGRVTAATVSTPGSWFGVPTERGMVDAVRHMLAWRGGALVYSPSIDVFDSAPAPHYPRFAVQRLLLAAARLVD